jgi:hypothetical protein
MRVRPEKGRGKSRRPAPGFRICGSSPAAWTVCRVCRWLAGLAARGWPRSGEAKESGVYPIACRVRRRRLILRGQTGSGCADSVPKLGPHLRSPLSARRARHSRGICGQFTRLDPYRAQRSDCDDAAIVFHAMKRAPAAPLIAAFLLALAGCASQRPPGCGEPGGSSEAAACRQYDYLIEIYRPGSRPSGW